jgi:hypothetical protein
VQSEEQLRKLCSEHGASVVENLMAIYGGLASRWLSAFEAADDATLSFADAAPAIACTFVRAGRATRRLLLREWPILPCSTTLMVAFIAWSSARGN